MQLVAISALVVVVIAGVAALFVLKGGALESPQGKPRADLEAASKDPGGFLHFVAGPDDEFVFRYQAGNCTVAGGPEMELSDDEGWSFRSIRLPQVDDGTGIGAATPAISAIASVSLEGRRRFVISGADDECRLRTFVTTDAGTTWTQKEFNADAWYVDPKSGVVYSPIGPANVECPGIANLTGFDDVTALAYCTDGSIHQSSDGVTWDRSGSTDEAASAVFFESPDDGYAIWADGDCQSMVFRTTNGGSSWSERGCVYPELTIPGIGGTEDVLMAGGNGPVFVSDDGGETWTRPEPPEVVTAGPTDGPSASPTDEPTDGATDEPDEPTEDPTDDSSDDEDSN